MPGIKKPDKERIGIVWQDPVLLQVGKNGLTDETIAETKRLLKKHKYMKVRLLRSTGVDKDTKQDMFEELCTRAGATLAGIRGNTAVIYRLRR